MYKFKNVPIATAKELFGLRPCSVNGRKAWFHCWIQTEHPYFLSTSFLSREEAKEISHEIENMTIIPSSFKVEKITQVVALVEYDNGAVVKVNPEEITFEDGRKEENSKPFAAKRIEFSDSAASIEQNLQEELLGYTNYKSKFYGFWR